MKKSLLVGLVAVMLLGCGQSTEVVEEVKDNGSEISVEVEGGTSINVESGDEVNTEGVEESSVTEVEQYNLVSNFEAYDEVLKVLEGMLYEKDGKLRCYLKGYEGEEVAVDVEVVEENGVKCINMYYFEGLVDTQELDKKIESKKDKVESTFVVKLNENLVNIYE